MGECCIERFEYCGRVGKCYIRQSVFLHQTIWSEVQEHRRGVFLLRESHKHFFLIIKTKCAGREGSVTSRGGWSFRGSVWAVLSLSRPFRDRHIALLLSDMQCGTHLIYENLASSVEAAVSLKITPAPCCTRAWALCCKVSSSDASNSIPFALMPLKSLLSYWISKQDYWPPDDKRHTGGQRSGYGFMPPCYITAGEWLIVRYRSLAVCESVWMLLISIILKLKPLQSHDLLLLLPWWRGQPQCH